MPFTKCISNINNTQIDNAKDTNVVIPMYNLIEYNNNYQKESESLWKYYRDDQPSDQIVNSKSFVSKTKITGNTPNNYNKKYWNSSTIKLLK